MDADQKVRRRLESAQRAWRCAQRLNDGCKLLLALAYYARRLPVGQWTRLRLPRRERSRKLNPKLEWRTHRTAARRLLGIRSRKTTDNAGRRCDEYHLARDPWRAAQIRLAMDVPPRQGYTRAAQAFDNALLNPKTEQQFRAIRADFKLSPEVQELASRLGPLLIKRTKAYLCRDIDPKTLEWLLACERERRRPEAAPAAEVPAPPPSEMTVRQFAKAFLNKAQYSGER